jgi:hypothetical protein
MWYFLANRELVAHQDIQGVRTPLKMQNKEDAEFFVSSMNERYHDKIFQCFYSNTDIKLHE